MIAAGNGCEETERNRITAHFREENLYSRQIATFLATATETEDTTWTQLSKLGYFPINLNTLSGAQRDELQFPSSTNENVYNIRNSFNVFGHFFLWTGYLALFDMILTTLFLMYWIFVMKPFQTVPNLNKLVSRMAIKNDLSFVNLDVPVTLSVAAETRDMDRPASLGGPEAGSAPATINSIQSVGARALTGALDRLHSIISLFRSPATVN